jgi:iron complex transport system ATP-binding protein
MKLLELRDVHFSYAHPVLTGVTLDVCAGELVALLGPNGAGKSTLLGLAHGQLQPQRGEVRLNGGSLAGLSRRELARQIGLVAQQGELQFPLTALEFTLAGRFAHAQGFGFDAARDVESARAALRATDAVQFAARHFNELSSGEKQRVLLARALAQEPRLLLLDEPTANADLAHQLSLLDLVRQLTRERQLAALLVTHEINLAAEFADRIALLKDGRLLACGAPHEVITEPLLGEAFGTPLLVGAHPQSRAPHVFWRKSA